MTAGHVTYCRYCIQLVLAMPTTSPWRMPCMFECCGVGESGKAAGASLCKNYTKGTAFSRLQWLDLLEEWVAHVKVVHWDARETQKVQKNSYRSMQARRQQGAQEHEREYQHARPANEYCKFSKCMLYQAFAVPGLFSQRCSTNKFEAKPSNEITSWSDPADMFQNGTFATKSSKQTTEAKQEGLEGYRWTPNSE